MRANQTTLFPDPAIKRGMKVLYQSLSFASVSDGDIKDYETILLPSDAYENVQSELTSSTSQLPVSMRRMKDWQVGNLQRFDNNKTASA